MGEGPVGPAPVRTEIDLSRLKAAGKATKAGKLGSRAVKKHDAGVSVKNAKNAQLSKPAQTAIAKRAVINLALKSRILSRMLSQPEVVRGHLIKVKGVASRHDVLQNEVNSTKALAELSRVLDDKEFSQCSGAIFGRLRDLEAEYHLDNLVREGDSQETICRSLAQQHAFSFEVADKPLISETADFVASHLKDKTTNEHCQSLMARMAKTDVDDLMLRADEYLELMDEGMVKRLRAAKKQGPEVLEAENQAVSKEIEAKLSQNKLKGIKFVQLLAKTINSHMVEEMLQSLGSEDRDTLRDALVKQHVKDLEGEKFGKGDSQAVRDRARKKLHKDAELLVQVANPRAKPDPAKIVEAIKELKALVAKERAG